MASRTKPGSKADRDAVRSDMLATGADRGAIAAEMRARWAMRPREAWRHAHGWSLQEAADRFNDTADPAAPPAIADASQYGKWEKWPAPASRRPSLAVLALMAEVYGCTVDELLDLDDRRHLPESDLRVLRNASSPAPTAPPLRAPEPDTVDLVGPELVHMAAAESSTWAQWAENSNVGDIALDQLLADVRSISVAYLTSDPVSLFARTRLLRDRTFALLEGHQPPRQATELYVAAGYLCGLLSWMSSDLGHLHAADTQARTAWLCSELAGHDGLRAWVSSTRSKIAYWDRRYRDAINHARRGATYTVPGTVGTLLACQEADAWAELGAADEAQAALHRAEAVSEAQLGGDDIGGIFKCGPVRHANYSSGVHLRTGSAPAALSEADGALAQLALLPVRAYGTEAQLNINRAAAHLVSGQPDGALEALRPVLAMPPERRLDTVTQRLQQLALGLARGPVADSASAREIHGQVEVYCRESAPRIALSPSGAVPGLMPGHD